MEKKIAKEESAKGVGGWVGVGGGSEVAAPIVKVVSISSRGLELVSFLRASNSGASP